MARSSLLALQVSIYFQQGCIKFLPPPPPWGRKENQRPKMRGREGKRGRKGKGKKMKSKRGRVTAKERDGWGRRYLGREVRASNKGTDLSFYILNL